jgi:flagellar basal-body rod modification protein FlgD
MNGIDTSTLPGLGPPPAGDSQGANTLGQAEFLEIMVAQIRNQDPFKPLENGDFIAQMAQFSTVEGVQSLNQAFEGLAGSLHANEALQAAALLGREALVPAFETELAAGQGLGGAVEVPFPAAGLSVEVRDASGAVVRRLDLGPQPEGLAAFAWDGLDGDGRPAPAGHYTVTPSGVRYDGRSEALQGLLAARVDSVTLAADGSGVALELQGLGSVGLDQVRRIN